MRKLDFIVFGLARSGTTAMANLLSAVKTIYCGIEVFNPHEDHTNIRVPRDYLLRLKSLQEAGQRIPLDLERTIATLRSKNEADILAYGNKYPLYYHQLDRVMGEIGSDKAIMCQRSYWSSAYSYARIAGQPNNSWPDGRGAFFAAADTFLLVKCLAKTKQTNTLVVPQANLARDWRKTAETIAKYLLPDADIEIDMDFIAEIERRRLLRQSLPKVELAEEDRALLTLLDEAGVGEVFERDEPYYLGEVMAEVQKVSKNLPADHIKFVEEAAGKHGNAEVGKFFPKWKAIAERSYT